MLIAWVFVVDYYISTVFIKALLAQGKHPTCIAYYLNLHSFQKESTHISYCIILLHHADMYHVEVMNCPYGIYV